MNKLNWKQILTLVVTIIGSFVGGNVTPPLIVDNKTDVVTPAVVTPPAPVAKTTPESWIITKDGKRVENDSLVQVLAALADGVYEGIGIPKPGDPFVNRRVTISPTNPTPNPVVVVPPAPVPTPTPTPTPPTPITTGAREVVILREAKAVSETMALQLTALRVGTNDSYLQSKGHNLYICDDDDVTPDGSPDPYVQSMLKIMRDENQKTGKNVQMPAEFIVDKTTNVLLSLEPFTTSTNTMTHLKANGG